MKIVKYQYLKNNKYKIYLDKIEVILYEDVIIKNSVLLKKELTKEELEKLLNENSFYEYYYKSLKYLNIKMRSEKEIRKYLSKCEIKNNIINEIVSRLKKEGYINDAIYAKSYINDQINLKINGPYKIMNDLKKLGIKEEIINKNIQIFTKEMQIEKIKKYIDKQVKINRKKSIYILKNNLLTNLVNLGYERNDITYELDSIYIDEEDIRKKEYEKIYNKLKNKYSGQELEYKIKQKMYMKGFY